MSKEKPTWVYLYGDEMPEVWEHFGFPFPDPDDRMKLKFVKYEIANEQGEEDLISIDDDGEN